MKYRSLPLLWNTEVSLYYETEFSLYYEIQNSPFIMKYRSAFTMKIKLDQMVVVFLSGMQPNNLGAAIAQW